MGGMTGLATIALEYKLSEFHSKGPVILWPIYDKKYKGLWLASLGLCKT